MTVTEGPFLWDLSSQFMALSKGLRKSQVEEVAHLVECLPVTWQSASLPGTNPRLDPLFSWMWWCTLVISALGSPKREHSSARLALATQPV